jgi:LuxR family maltose regulon positive regulatory protein
MKDEVGQPLAHTTFLAEAAQNHLPHTTSFAGSTPASIFHPSAFLLHPSKVAWIGLDEGDNDPNRFWSYFAQALEPWQPGLSQSFAEPGSLGQPRPIEQALTGLINRLAALSQEVWLVLDDYHVIEAPAIHRGMAFLLDHQPPALHLVITSRTEPPLPLARLRARRQLVEIRAADLRFTAEEAATFLNRVMQLNLSAENLAALEERTEGWIAGLQLAALSMQGQPDIAGFIKAFNGSNRFMLDYLAEEVLNRQSAEVQHFLLQTSILDRLTASLVEELTGCEDGQAMLDHLEQSNLFVLALDQERHWYRYHHLFGEYLRSRLQRTQPEHVGLLHHLAANWYEQNNLPSQAIQHALAGQDFEKAARLVEQIAIPTLMQGQTNTVLGWFKTFSQALLQLRPELHLAYAWSLAINQQLDAAYLQLENIRLGLSDTIAETKPGWWPEFNAVRALVAINRGDMAGGIELGREALKDLDKDNLAFRLPVMSILTIVYSFTDGVNIAETIQALNEIVSISRATNHYFITGLASGIRGLVQAMLQGELRQASRSCQEVFQLVYGQPSATEESQHPLQNSLPNVMGHFLFGELLRERNDFEAAAAQFNKGIEICHQWSYVMPLFIGNIFLARLKQSQGDREGALAALAASEHVEQIDATVNPMITLLSNYRVWVWLSIGELEKASRWAQRFEGQPEIALNSQREMEIITLAKVRLAQNKPRESYKLLEPLLETAKTAGRGRAVITVYMLQALALQAQGQSDLALSKLELAIKLAEPEEFVRLFADEGLAMAALLTKLLKNIQLKLAKDPPGHKPPISLQYISRLLKACDPHAQLPEKKVPGTSSGFHPSSFILHPLTEPLSERELEILRLLDAGHSGPEIAQTLVLSHGTVKWHIKNIYGKLNAHTRILALTRAHQLGLL